MTGAGLMTAISKVATTNAEYAEERHAEDAENRCGILHPVFSAYSAALASAYSAFVVAFRRRRSWCVSYRVMPAASRHEAR